MDRRKVDRRRGAEPELTIPNIEDILAVLYRRKIVLLMLISIPVLLGYMYIRTIPDSYNAKASIILEHKNLNMSEFDDILGGIKFDDLTAPTQIGMIKSAPLIRETISTLGLGFSDDKKTLSPLKIDYQGRADQNSIDYKIQKELLRNLDIKQPKKSRILEVSYSSTVPEYATKIVNTHTKHYIFSQIRAKKEQAEKVNAWIERQIEALKKENIEVSNAVQKFKSNHGMVQGVNTQDLIYQQISDIARQMSPLETDVLDLQARVDLLNTTPDSSAIREIINSGLIQELKARASAVAQRTQALTTSFGDSHPEVIAANKELVQIKSDIDSEIKSITDAIRNELATKTKQQNLLEKKLLELKIEANLLQKNQVLLTSLEREELAGQTLLDNFLARSEEIKSQIDFTKPDVRVLSFAEIPGEASGSKKKLMMVVLLVASLFFAMAVIFLLEIIDSGLKDLETVKQLLNIKLLGTLPYDKKPISSILNKQRSLYTEEIKRIYIHLKANKNTKTVLFTSARSGEGKSATVVALAYYINTIGKKALLVDANTISPNVSKMAGTKASPGFYDLLAGTHKPKDVIVTNEAGVEIIPAGDQTSFSSDLIISGRFEKPLKELREQYDFVLIDSSPALDVSDAQILANLCDETVLIAAWAKTPKKLLKLATESMREMSINTPQIILNKMPASMLKKK